MKILNVVVAKIWGGGEQYVYDTSKVLAVKGIKVYIAVDKRNTALQQRFGEVAEVVTADLYSLAGIKAFRKLKDFIEQEQIDIINCHSGHAMLLCLLLKLNTKAKLVCFKHNALKAKNDLYHQWQRKQTDAFVCVSKLVYDLQTDGLKHIEKEKYHLIYNGIDTDKFDKLVKEKHSDFVVGYAGRIAKDKGLDTLLEAFAELHGDYRLIVAGSDEKGYKDEFEKLIKAKQLDCKVTFLGQLKDMISFYSKIDVLVLPSRVREAFGLVICEAMYCGVPVITTNSGAQSEIITEDKYGKLVNVGDNKTICREIIRLQNDPVYYQHKVIAARLRVQHFFTVEECANNLQVLYENITCKI